MRYHKAVFTKVEHWERLTALTDELNTLKWGYSLHCLDSIKDRAIDLEGLLRFIKGVKLEVKTIFEYYLDDKGEPEKVCYRISEPTGLDLILCLSSNKEIISIWLNTVDDLHFTLKTELYAKG